MPSSPKEQVDYGAPFTSSGVCGGLDLGPPLVPGCCRCGEKPPRERGNLTTPIDGERRPVCRNEVACEIRVRFAAGSDDEYPPTTPAARDRALEIAETLTRGRVVPDANGGLCIYRNRTDHIHIHDCGTAEEIVFDGNGKVKRQPWCGKEGCR